MKNVSFDFNLKVPPPRIHLFIYPEADSVMHAAFIRAVL